jgi:hypothetical protein
LHFTANHVRLELVSLNDDSATFIENRGNAGIGCTSQVTTYFQSAHPGDLQMLVWGSGVLEPGIVADIDQPGRLRQRPANFAAEDCFKADRDTDRLTPSP